MFVLVFLFALFLSCSSYQNVLSCKKPQVLAGLPSGTAITKPLTAQQKTEFEHLLSQSVCQFSGANWSATELLRRLLELVKNAPNATSDSVYKAFSGGKVDVSISGAVGNDQKVILNTLSNGNFREKLTLVYIATSTTRYFSDLMLILVSDAISANSNVTLQNLGINIPVAFERYQQIKYYSSSDPLYISDGMSTFGAPSYFSWARFLYNGPGNATAGQQDSWKGCRTAKRNCEPPTSVICNESPFNSSNNTIVPPLSEAEIRFQCNGSSSCKLHWQPGALYWQPIANTPFGNNVPGFVDRANALGYRTLTGPSGTSDRTLFTALVLGFTQQELALLRIAMIGWMVDSDDHSFYEIMTASDAFVPPKFQMEQGYSDISRLMADDVTIVSGGPQIGTIFLRNELLLHIKQSFTTSSIGQSLLKVIGDPEMNFLMLTCDSSNSSNNTNWVTTTIITCSVGFACLVIGVLVGRKAVALKFPNNNSYFRSSQKHQEQKHQETVFSSHSYALM